MMGEVCVIGVQKPIDGFRVEGVAELRFQPVGGCLERQPLIDAQIVLRMARGERIVGHCFTPLRELCRMGTSRTIRLVRASMVRSNASGADVRTGSGIDQWMRGSSPGNSSWARA